MAPTTLTSVLVVGATGNVGYAVCLELLKLTHRFTRLAAFNNIARPSAEKDAIISALSASGMEIVTSDTYENPNLYKDFDAVIMALGNFGNYQQPLIIDAAIEGGVRHFYPSEFGADITVGENATQRYYRDKVLARNHLEKRAKDTEGLGWSYVTIGRFTEWGIRPYFGVNNKERTADIYGNEDGRQSLISVEDASALTARSLLMPFDAADPENRHRTFRFRGESPSWKEIFAILKRVTGYEYKVTYHDVSEAWALQKEAKEKNDEKLEMNSSHRIVQGTEGTLLPEPYDNDKFSDVNVKGVEEVLRATFADEKQKAFLGL
ncbi:NAD(P)-binding protein [Rhizodiscina lignyota]|uniref:NAD(P)-binding protein n=1 Tax=Rhizodiscina lignyota TaxID=1504668 RepID=A0A9P4I4F5_9PEZI|nr:NAD(P)-binding protein [Rhizodiscina lignyota]